MWDRMRKIAGKDFLTPLLASFLYGDFFQTFFPWPIPQANRNATLEAAWAAAFKKYAASEGGAGSNLFGERFLKLWPDEELKEKPWSALFLNGTWVETGRRIIASNIDVDAELIDVDAELSVEEDGHFATAHDFLNEIGGEISVAEAANVASRFPFMEAPGSIRRDSEVASFRGHVVDGGYFENFGAETAIDILVAEDHWRQKQENEGGSDEHARLVIVISSDPTLSGNFDEVKCGDEKSGLQRPECSVGGSPFLSSLLGPQGAFFAAREARGHLAVERLRKQARDMEAGFVHFKLCPSANENGVSFDPPLSWALSTVSQHNIDQSFNTKNFGPRAPLYKLYSEKPVLRWRLRPPAMRQVPDEPKPILDRSCQKLNLEA